MFAYNFICNFVVHWFATSTNLLFFYYFFNKRTNYIRNWMKVLQIILYLKILDFSLSLSNFFIKTNVIWDSILWFCIIFLSIPNCEFIFGEWRNIEIENSYPLYSWCLTVFETNSTGLLLLRLKIGVNLFADDN